jgi:predicted type IV restriction endonuclease
MRSEGERNMKMKSIISCIEDLRTKLDRHRKDGLNEYPTRTIFIDPLLQALGWDVREPDEVELEYPTIEQISSVLLFYGKAGFVFI